MNLKKIRLDINSILKTFCICILVLMVVALYPFLSVATQNTTPENQFVEINNTLKDFKRAEAYAQMKVLYEIKDLDKHSEIYLTNLSWMIKTEKMYKKFDEMVKHAIELYELTNSTDSYFYKTTAIDALAYYEYLNYNNTSATEKLAEMVRFPDGDKSYQYLQNIAFIEIDLKHYEKADVLFKEALKDPELEKPTGVYFSELMRIHVNLADNLYEMGKREASQVEMERALMALNPADYDLVVEVKMYLATYYYNSGAYTKAKQYLEEIYATYEKTSTIFQEILPLEAIKTIEGNLEYQNKNFKGAADIYYQLNKISTQNSFVEKNLAANQALNAFNNSQMNKNLSLLEQLSVEQAEKNKVQAKYLSMAYRTIILLAALILVTLLVSFNYKKQQKRMYQLSITDQLTQLYNRRKIVEEFEQIQSGTKYVALMDVDHFKDINDTFGHHVGDEVLKKIAATIKVSIRVQDQVGRYGGEEFLVIIDTDNLQIAAEVAERIRENIENITWEYEGLKTTISIGLVKATDVGDPLLIEADELLYESKAAGRNRLTYR